MRKNTQHISVTVKKDLVSAVSQRPELRKDGLRQPHVAKVVDALMEEICHALQRGNCVDLRNFGKFDIVSVKARTAYHFGNGHRVQLPEKFRVSFRPSKKMNEAIEIYHEGVQDE